MKLSKSGIGTTKLQNIDKMFPGQDILIQSGQLVQYGAGIYGINNVPLQLKIIITNIVREELNKVDCIEVLLPSLQPDTLWKESGRLEQYVTSGLMLIAETSKGNYCLAPTAEEAITAFVKKKVKSYKQLPITLYQISEKYRNEMRARGFLFRGKAFDMMDAYSFNESEDSLKQSYNKIKQAYMNIFKRLELPVISVAADNGDMGGKVSEEFMLLSELGEDTILYDTKTGKGLNKEILERDNYQQYLKDEHGIDDMSSLEERRTIELGHIFQLGKKYSESMNAIFTDKDEQDKPFFMGCYGIGITRLLGTIYEQNVIKDQNNNIKGIALPKSIAPYKLQIIPKMDSSEKVKEANQLYQTLKEKNISVIIDDREDLSIGAKIKECFVLGTPYMIVLGDKLESGQYELESIKTGEKQILSQEELIKILDI